LFPFSVGGRKRRQWLHEEAQRLCKTVLSSKELFHPQPAVASS